MYVAREFRTMPAKLAYPHAVAPESRLLPHVGTFIAAAPPVHRAGAAQQQVCSHWPLNAAVQLQAASATVRSVLDVWERAAEHARAARIRQAGCLDLAVAEGDPQLDILLLHAALLPDKAHALTLALHALAADFEKISAWLIRSGQSTCNGKKAADEAYARLAVMRDDHRVIARDWLAADMNALIAWMLRRAVRVLERMDFAHVEIASDLLGARAYQAPITSVAALLDQAGVLAHEAAAFVDNFDRQWGGLRELMTTVIASSPLADAPTPAAHWPVLQSA